MRRRLPVAVGLLLALLLAAGAYARLFAGGPLRFLPGGWLSGELVTEPVSDWSFAAGRQYVDVESRAGWLPYSSSCWFMVHEGDFYLLLPSLFGAGLHERLQRDAAVRVRIGGRVYPQRAVPFADEEHLAELLSPMLRRTMAVEIEGPVRRVSRPAFAGGQEARMWIYRLENPPRV